MHEKTVERKRKKALRLVILAALLVLGLIWLTSCRGGEKNADSPEARLDFIQSLGWEISEIGEKRQEVKIPDCSDGAMADYNAMMQTEGYDLAPYAGKTVQQYGYEITNYPDYAQTVYLTLYVCDGRVIGGDIHTAAINGFMHALRARPADAAPSATPYN